MPDVGDLAPDFTLPDERNEPVTLSSLRGGTVMLVFFPLAFSSTCTTELCAIRDDFDAYRSRDVTVLGISVDSRYSLAAWKREQGYPNTFLSDRWPLGAVIKAYDAWNEEKGYAHRVTYIVGPDGVIQHKVQDPSDKARDEAGYVIALDRLPAPR